MVPPVSDAGPCFVTPFFRFGVADMGRRERHDVDYFPFIVKDGKTLFILESKYQAKGTGFFTNVLRFLSLQTDHHFQFKDHSDRLWFFSKVKCDEESGEDMLNLMVETGKLDKALFDIGVLACEDFLINIADAYRKRINKCVTISEIRALYGITSAGNGKTTGRKAEEKGLPRGKGGINPHSIVEYSREEYILTAKKKKLSGKRYEAFMLFWNAFDYKKDRAQAADSWLAIPELTDSLVAQIVKAAEREANERPGMIDAGKTPKMAQGWLTARRWEDEEYHPHTQDSNGETEFTRRMREEREAQANANE